MLLTLKDAAKQLQCSPETIRKMVASGEILGLRINERCIRIEQGDLDSYIQTKRMEAERWQSQKTAKLVDINRGSEILLDARSPSHRQNISRRVQPKQPPKK